MRLGPVVTALATVALVGGAAAAQARLAALDATALHPLVGHELTRRATLLEAPRPTSTGGERALVRLASGRGAGETVLARIPGAGARRNPRAGQGSRRGTKWWSAASCNACARGTRGRGFGALTRCSAVRFVRSTGRRRGGVAGVVDAIRRRAEAGLDGGLDPPEAALARGMVLGQDERLSAAARTDFQRSGLAHILAASGQNVMLLAALALPLLAAVGLGLRARLAGVLLLVALYVPLAGAGPSIQRAGVMGAAGLIAAIAGRRSSRWYALLLAAAVTLLLDPRAVADPGWQLSFAAVIAILALAAPLRDRLVRRGLPRGLAEATALTVAATLGTAPLLAHHFDRVSPVSLPANLLATPAVAPAMWLGMLSAAAAQVATPLAHLLDASGAVSARVPGLARARERGAARSGAVAAPELVVGRRRGLCGPGHGRPPSPPSREDVRNARRSVRKRTLGALVAVAATLAAATLASGRDGPTTKPLTISLPRYRPGRRHAHPGRREDRTRRCRAAGRADPRPAEGRRGHDHRPARRHPRPGRPRGWCTPACSPATGSGSCSTAPPATARRSTWRSCAPPRRRTPAASRPSRARCCAPGASASTCSGRRGRPRTPAAIRTSAPSWRCPRRRFDLLLPADAESDVTAPLSLPPVDALKVAHHGSEDPGLPDLLQRLRPRVAVIEVGRRNTYGHPTPQALNAVKASGAALYRTDRDGTVRLTVTGDRLRVVAHG